MPVVVRLLRLLVIRAAKGGHGFEHIEREPGAERRAMGVDLQIAAVIMISRRARPRHLAQKLERILGHLPFLVRRGLGHIAQLNDELEAILRRVVRQPLRLLVKNLGMQLRVELGVWHQGNAEPAAHHLRRPRRHLYRSRQQRHRLGLGGGFLLAQAKTGETGEKAERKEFHEQGVNAGHGAVLSGKWSPLATGV